MRRLCLSMVVIGLLVYSTRGMVRAQSPSEAPCGTWLTFSSVTGDFGSAQTEPVGPGGIYYITRLVDFVSSATGHVYTARAYRNWSPTSFQVRFYSFYQDAEPRNYIEDGEDIIGACVGMGEGPYDAYIKTIIFDDTTGVDPGVLDANDTIASVYTSDVIEFVLNGDPTIFRLRPKQLDNGKLFWIIGDNFGPTIEDSVVHIGKQTFSATQLPQRIKSWDSTRIKVRASNYTCTAFGGPGSVLKRNVWVTVGGVDSNRKTLTINQDGCLP